MIVYSRGPLGAGGVRTGGSGDTGAGGGVTLRIEVGAFAPAPASAAPPVPPLASGALVGDPVADGAVASRGVAFVVDGVFAAALGGVEVDAPAPSRPLESVVDDR
ncbi:MAG: hypothetical protein FJ253_12865, partial [Phycisphaerae bacterium]|nr:hypothetical protein [Phycisphaerae bacterium]